MADEDRPKENADLDEDGSSISELSSLVGSNTAVYLFYDFISSQLQHLEFLSIECGGGPADCNINRMARSGRFNVLLRTDFKNGRSVAARIPIKGKSRSAGEKLANEVAVLRFLEKKTRIRVPHVFYYDSSENHPHDIGPFMIMEYFNHKKRLIDIHWDRCSKGIAFLHPGPSPVRLNPMWIQMADIMLELCNHQFTQIGSIGMVNGEGDSGDSWTVINRPLTSMMHDTIHYGEIPKEEIEIKGPCKTTREFFLSLIDLRINAVVNGYRDDLPPESFNRWLVALCLLRKLADEGKLSKPDFETGPFQLFCDDMGPKNVLCDSNFENICAIDWEFTYAAPMDFIHCPPSWLMYGTPRLWDGDLEELEMQYEEQLLAFVFLLDSREKIALDNNTLRAPANLAYRMMESWELGRFWIMHVLTRTEGLEKIYWQRIDKKFFGEGDFNDRILLVSQMDKRALGCAFDDINDLKASITSDN